MILGTETEQDTSVAVRYDHVTAYIKAKRLTEAESSQPRIDIVDES